MRYHHVCACQGDRINMSGGNSIYCIESCAGSTESGAAANGPEYQSSNFSTFYFLSVLYSSCAMPASKECVAP